MSAPGAAMRLSPRPKYLSLARMAVQQAAAYRLNIVLNLIANFAWVTVLYYVWRTVFAAESQVGGFDWDEMRTYILVSYAVNSLLSFSAEGRLIHSIRSGEVAVDLIRPVDIQTMHLALMIGAAVVEGAISMIFALALGFAVLNIEPPASALAGVAFAVSVGLGFLVKALIGYMVGLLTFWTQNAVGLRWVRAAITNVFSGALIPLALFPDALRTVAEVLPFQAVINTPLAIYLGETHGLALAGALAVQIGWIGALWLLARVLWVPAARTLTVQGG